METRIFNDMYLATDENGIIHELDKNEYEYVNIQHELTFLYNIVENNPTMLRSLKAVENMEKEIERLEKLAGDLFDKFDDVSKETVHNLF